MPIWAEVGRTGGYVLDRARTLPPVDLTAGEAVALAVALHRLRGTPFAAAAGTALRKLAERVPERELAPDDLDIPRERVRRLSLV